MRNLMKQAAMATAAIALLGAVPAHAETKEAESEATEKKAKKQKKKKITDRRHPDYVRCRSEHVMGSLARKKRVCMTNREWVEYTRTGSRNAREFVDDMQVGMNGQPGT